MLKYWSIALLSLFLLACNSEDGPMGDPISAEPKYVSPNFANNASNELNLIGSLEELTAEIQKGRNGDLLSLSDLNALYPTSLKDATVPSYSNLVENKFIPEAAESSSQTFILSDSIANGGVYEGYLFNKNGLEPQQMIEKGLFGAALYYQASMILKNDMSSADLDRVLALFGSNPDFPNSDNADLHENPDKLLAKYGARRDKKDGNGYYRKIQSDFINLKITLEANNSSDQTIESYISSIKSNWEKINAATVVNYCYEIISLLSNTNLSDEDKASALHSYSEVVAFVYGWKVIPEADKIASTVELTSILENLKVKEGENEQSYLFALKPAENLVVIQNNVLPAIKEIYSFSDTEMEDFKLNWVSNQNR